MALITTRIGSNRSKASAAQAFIASKPAAHLAAQETLRRLVAEAAYYRAEKRGFAPNHEEEDWLEAEREVRQRFSAK